MSVDIKDKIAKLLALADSPSEGEAKAALLKARELMARHKLRPEDVKKAENVRVVKEHVGVSCTGMTDPWAISLSAIIAEHYCCKAYRTNQAGKKSKLIGFVGLEDDFAICKRVYLYAIDCIKATCKEISAENKGISKTLIRQMCNAYGWGFCSGLKSAFAEQNQQHQEWGLVLVTPKQVMDVMNDMGKPKSFGRPDWADDWKKDHGRRGYQDGREFDPETRLSDGKAVKSALIGSR